MAGKAAKTKKIPALRRNRVGELEAAMSDMAKTIAETNKTVKESNKTMTENHAKTEAAIDRLSVKIEEMVEVSTKTSHDVARMSARVEEVTKGLNTLDCREW